MRLCTCSSNHFRGSPTPVKPFHLAQWWSQHVGHKMRNLDRCSQMPNTGKGGCEKISRFSLYESENVWSFSFQKSSLKTCHLQQYVWQNPSSYHRTTRNSFQGTALNFESFHYFLFTSFLCLSYGWFRHRFLTCVANTFRFATLIYKVFTY